MRLDRQPVTSCNLNRYHFKVVHETQILLSELSKLRIAVEPTKFYSTRRCKMCLKACRHNIILPGFFHNEKIWQANCHGDW